MNRFRIINIVLLTTSFVVAAGTYQYWQVVCVDGGCSAYLKTGILRPLLWGSLGLAQTLAVLLFFSPNVFKYWLVGIFSWVFPLSIYLISQIDTHSSAMLSTTRGEFAWLLSFLLFVITTVYIVGKYLYDCHKKTTNTSDFIRLLVLIPIAIIVYIYSPFG